jgi:hypothetical protein
MSQQQFELIQSQIFLLNPAQLKSLQNEIAVKLVKDSEPILNEDERSMIAALFN